MDRSYHRQRHRSQLKMAEQGVRRRHLWVFGNGGWGLGRCGHWTGLLGPGGVTVRSFGTRRGEVVSVEEAARI